MKGAAALVAFFIVIAWFMFGHPATDIANALWQQNPAPWEDVTAYYYPDSSQMDFDSKFLSVGTITVCRDWGATTIAASIDPNGEHSAYACGIACATPKDPKTCRTITK